MINANYADSWVKIYTESWKKNLMGYVTLLITMTSSEDNKNIISRYINKICRICLIEKFNMKPLFCTYDGELSTVPLCEQLAVCSSLDISENDGLPAQVCNECEGRIGQAYQLRIQCQKSDLNLRSLVNNGFVSVNGEMPNSILCQAESINRNKTDEKLLYMKQSEKYETDVKISYLGDSNCTEEIIIESENNEEGNISDIQLFGCKECTKTFLTEIEKIEHFDQHIKHECPSNNTLLKNTQLLKSESFLNKNGINCTFCDKECPHKTAFNKHMKLHVQQGKTSKMVCNDCGLCLTTVSALKRHSRKHKIQTKLNKLGQESERRYQCLECDKSYTTPANLQIHSYLHSGERPYKCEFCGRGFTKTVSLNSHLAIHTGIKTHLCSECGRGFTSTAILNQHKKIHTEDRPYTCKTCYRGFRASGDLRVHMRCHTGERPYLCPICGRAFSRITHLNTHLRTHTGERPYVCTECGRGFAQSGDLRSHHRTHTGEKPYACYVCEKRFIQSSGLTSHMTTHSGVKNHACSICKKAFSQASSLARHLKVHSENL